MKEMGWISVHRELMKKPIWLNSTPEHKCILITLLLMANHEEGQWEWMGRKFKVDSGQFVTSIEGIKSRCGKGISFQNIRSALKRFEKLEFLTNESTSTGRLITILNYESYQTEKRHTNNDTNKVVTKVQQSCNKAVTTNNNNNKNNNDNKEDIYISKFDLSRKKYPGTKRGLETEFANFKRHKDWRQVLDILESTIEDQIKMHESKTYYGEFCPEWKHFKTWINNRCWEEKTNYKKIERYEYKRRD